MGFLRLSASLFLLSRLVDSAVEMNSAGTFEEVSIWGLLSHLENVLNEQAERVQVLEKDRIVKANAIHALQRKVDHLESTINSQKDSIVALQADRGTGLLQRHLQSDTCLPTLINNVCVYDGIDILFQDTDILVNSSKVTFSGPDPVLVNRTLYDEESYNELFSQVLFNYTSVIANNSNMTFTSETLSNGGKITYNNTDLLFNSSNIIVTGADRQAVNKSLYDSETYESLFSRLLVNYTDVEFDVSNVVHKGAKHSYVSSSVEHRNTEATYIDSDLLLDNSLVELKGHRGRLLSRVDTEIRGPEYPETPIDFKVTRQVKSTFEDGPKVTFEDTAVEFENVDVVFKGNGRLLSRVNTEIRGPENPRDATTFKVTEQVNVRFEQGPQLEISPSTRFTQKVTMRNDLDVDGKLDVDGVTYLDGLEVTGMTDMDDVAVFGTASIDILQVTNNAGIGGRLYANQGATIRGSGADPGLLKVEGSSNITRDLIVGGSFVSQSKQFENLLVTGNARVGSLVVDGTAQVVDAATIGTFVAGSGQVTGPFTAETLEFDSLDITGTASVQTLEVKGNASVAGSGTFGGLLTTDSLSVTSGLELDSLDITGTASVQTLEVRGDASVVGSGTVGGLLTTESLSVTSGLEFDSLDIAGTASVQTLEVRGMADVMGNIVVQGSGSQMNGLEITGTATIGSLDVGNAVVDGNIEIQGDLRMATDTVARFDFIVYDDDLDCTEIPDMDMCASYPLLS